MLNTDEIRKLMEHFADRGNEENEYYTMVICYAGEDWDEILLEPKRLEFGEYYPKILIFEYTGKYNKQYYYIDLNKISRIIIKDENGGEYK